MDHSCVANIRLVLDITMVILVFYTYIRPNTDALLVF
jgi:hypothetical protein